MMKATARAHSNIAFIKYWGKQNEELRIPLNGSISVNLSNQHTTTTVEFSSSLERDTFSLNGKDEDIKRISIFLDRVRKLSHIDIKARIVSENNFPTAGGLASSASGFAALSLAASTAAGLKLSEKELTILARLGSGSACRSVPHGFVEWKKGNSNETSYAVSLYPETYWDIHMIALIVSAKKKEIPSTLGQQKAVQNPFLQTRIERMNSKIQHIKSSLFKKNIHTFGEIMESETIEMHAIAMTSTPPILYWNSSTVAIMEKVWSLRRKGTPVYFTIDAGPHVYLLVEKKNSLTVEHEFKQMNEVKKIIINSPSKGTYLFDAHLF